MNLLVEECQDHDRHAVVQDAHTATLGTFVGQTGKTDALKKLERDLNGSRPIQASQLMPLLEATGADQGLDRNRHLNARNRAMARYRVKNGDTGPSPRRD